ncbi:MAG: CDP-diacylglycerol--serine O-phosphatidyltransferase, partial [Pseudomonadota bacterium]|nr:CDP-diacylglycerol--serine O-phosphatidyltransferase [Pseudomonadota bacterium]
AAGVVIGALWVAVDYDLTPDMLRIPVAILTAYAGLAMVSNLRYYSFKEVDFHGKVPYMLVVGVTLAVAVVITEPPLVLFSLFFLYTFSGLITTLRSRKKS